MLFKRLLLKNEWKHRFKLSNLGDQSVRVLIVPFVLSFESSKVEFKHFILKSVRQHLQGVRQRRDKDG